MATIVQPNHHSHPRVGRDEQGAASAEYAVVTAAGIGFGGVLIKLITSEWGQALLKKLLEIFLASVGVA